MFMPAEVWDLKQSKNSQNMSLYMILSIETYFHTEN